MRKRTPFVLVLPVLMVEELDKHLANNKVGFRYKREHFYYLISYLATKQITYKNREFMSLDLIKLKALTSSNIDRHLKLLVDIGLVITDGYKVGKKSKWYKLNQNYCKGLERFEIKTNSKLHTSLSKKYRNKRAHVNLLPHHLKLMRAELMNIDFDYWSANQWVLNNADVSKRIYYSLSLEHLKDKRLRYFKRNKTNQRLDTNLTTLKSELRQFIKGDYVSIDLVNSQPFLLGILIDSIIKDSNTLCYLLSNESMVQAFGIKRIKKSYNCHQNQEKAKMVTLNNYLDATKNGLLYDNFIKVFDGELKRKEVKDMFFKVLFSANGSAHQIPYKKEKIKFSNVYPLVGEIVKELKVNNHKTLPVYLQKLESYLFIDCIAKRLVDVGITPLTVHDSVIVKREHQQKVLAIMKDVFINEVGVIPTFKTESLAN